MGVKLERWKKRYRLERNELLQEVEELAQNAAGSYRELADSFAAYVTRREAEDGEARNRMFQTVSDRLCRSCLQKSRCWEEDGQVCLDAFAKSLETVSAGGSIAFEQLPEYLQGNCVCPQELLDELNVCLAVEHMRQSAFHQLLEGKEALVRQLKETADYLSGLPDKLQREMTVEGPTGKKLSRELRKYHIHVRGVHLYERKGRGRQLQMRLFCDPGRSVSVRLIERVVSECFGRRMKETGQWTRLVSAEEKTMLFSEEPDYFTLTGVAHSAKREQEVSGDSFSFFYEKEGEMAMILSDGMGSGEEAAAESEAVLSMLERMLSAGFQEETAIGLINSVLALRAEQQMFATLDMSILNLYTGMCEFVKIGGAATFLKRGQWIERVEAETLPIGMVQSIDYDSVSKKLYDGDYIIMMSDGVLEGVEEEHQRKFLQDVLDGGREENPQRIAGQILKASLQYQNFEPKDDMTVLVCGIFKNQAGACQFGRKAVK